MRAFLEIFRFECRMQARSPLYIAVAVLFFLIHFLTARKLGINIGIGANQDAATIPVNAAVAIIQNELVLSLFAIFPAVAIVAAAITRDHERTMAELFFVRPIREPSYVLGRFAGGLAFALLASLAGVLRRADFVDRPGDRSCATCPVRRGAVVVCSRRRGRAEHDHRRGAGVQRRGGCAVDRRRVLRRDRVAAHTARRAGVPGSRRWRLAPARGPVRFARDRRRHALLDGRRARNRPAGRRVAREPRVVAWPGRRGAARDARAVSIRRAAHAAAAMARSHVRRSAGARVVGRTRRAAFRSRRHARAAQVAAADGPARDLAQPRVLLRPRDRGARLRAAFRAFSRRGS